ncbi:hypothetical protein Y032_0334g2829 [Ancylostoma ceylanicum]|uniref:Uncharacterized protein n=1 Tax=Ancylostoma ceylanicum TaxID=53326 RepID=A0A016RYP8_9BILA|nr:hypothetical protein Y032_0334g2829 [Ancylostoma ceylanicum]
MPERRRPPPGQSFPFLRKGQGQKAKVNYPVLKRASTPSATSSPQDAEQWRVGSDAAHDLQSPHEDGHENWPQPNGTAAHADLEWPTTSARRTVETADSGFDQAGHLQHEQLPISSPDSTSSPHSSSIATTNVELRKGDAFRVQQRARGHNSSFSDLAPSPMLASTPHPDIQLDSPQGLPPVSSETSILGDTTNVMQQTDDSMLRKKEETRGEHILVERPACGPDTVIFEVMIVLGK